MIGKKIYFDNRTGEVIAETAEVRIGGRTTTIDEDISAFTALSERNRDTFDVKELAFGERASEFASCSGYWVNPQTKELEFSYPNPDDPETPITPEKSLPTQIEELKAENENLKTDNQILKERDAKISDDLIFVMEAMAAGGLV